MIAARDCEPGIRSSRAQRREREGWVPRVLDICPADRLGFSDKKAAKRWCRSQKTRILMPRWLLRAEPRFTSQRTRAVARGRRSAVPSSLSGIAPWDRTLSANAGSWKHDACRPRGGREGSELPPAETFDSEAGPAEARCFLLGKFPMSYDRTTRARFPRRHVLSRFPDASEQHPTASPVRRPARPRCA